MKINSATLNPKLILTTVSLLLQVILEFAAGLHPL